MTRPQRPLLILLSFITLSLSPAIATASSPDMDAPSWQSDSVSGHIAQALLWTGRLFEQTGDLDAAGAAYLASATYAPGIQDFLRLKAAENFLKARAPWIDGLERVEAKGALARPVPERALLQARTWHAIHKDILADDLPVSLITRALDEDASRDSACTWIQSYLDPNTSPTPWRALTKKLAKNDPVRHKRLNHIAQTIHARCDGDDRISWADARSVPIAPSSRIKRANLLYAGVHYYWTLAELDRVPFDRLATPSWCEAEFRRARATYRIRKLRKESDDIYLGVAKKCTAPDLATYRVRALYAVAKRNFDRGRYAPSKALFETILKDFPKRSHADDALLYLSRIARESRDSEKEAALMKRALRDYPEGDMVHELVWEVLEADFRAGNDKKFLSKLAALDLPEHDDNYLSQGRLEYLEGYVMQRSGDERGAKAAYLDAWQRYTFSFYGYMSWLALRKLKVPAKTLAISRDSKKDMDWLFDASWRSSDAAMLAEVGLHDWAAQVEELRLADSRVTPIDRWRIAWLYHMSGRFPLSHNIARRRIPGRPWSSPSQGRTVRWHIAWPNPFKNLVIKSMDAERAQRSDPKVSARPELPMAIMREESSFIPDIESYAGALGLMQLMPATARDHDADIDGAATPDRLVLPEVNVRVASDHIYTLADRLHAHPVVMTAAYNAGAGNARKWLRGAKDRHIAIWVEDIPYYQARNYTKRVIGSYLAYQWLLGNDTFDTRVGLDAPLP